MSQGDLASKGFRTSTLLNDLQASFLKDEMRSTCPPTIVASPHHKSGRPSVCGNLSGVPPIVYHTLIQPHFSRLKYTAGFPPTHNTSTNEDSMLITNTTTNYNERQIRLLEYLDNQVKAGKNFFKSKFIAREIGMSPKEVGTNMGILAESCTKFSIQKYSYSNSTTWLITASQI
jgi:hypothetical protein